MEGEVLVPDVKPVIGIERQRRVAAKRVTTHPPATLLVEASCQRVQHAIDVGGHVQAKVVEVVAGVDNTAQVGRHLAQPGKEPGSTEPSAQHGDHLRPLSLP